MNRRKPKVCQYSKCPFEDKTFIPRFATTEKTHFNYMCQMGYLEEFNSEKEIKARRKEYKTNVSKSVFSYLQDEINKIARLIDYKQDCCSCDKRGGTFTEHGGHLISRGRNATLRYHLLIIWNQCDQCNTHKSGNEGAYWEKLELMFGEEFVKELKGLQVQYKILQLKSDQAKQALKIARQIVAELSARKKLRTKEERIELRREFIKRLGIYS